MSGTYMDSTVFYKRHGKILRYEFNRGKLKEALDMKSNSENINDYSFAKVPLLCKKTWYWHKNES